MKYVVVNIGCLECGVSTEVLGIYDDEETANQIAAAQDDWREGGSSEAAVFAVRYP